MRVNIEYITLWTGIGATKSSSFSFAEPSTSPNDVQCYRVYFQIATKRKTKKNCFAHIKICSVHVQAKANIVCLLIFPLYGRWPFFSCCKHKMASSMYPWHNHIFMLIQNTSFNHCLNLFLSSRNAFQRSDFVRFTLGKFHFADRKLNVSRKTFRFLFFFVAEKQN